MTAASDDGFRDAIRRDEFAGCYRQYRDWLRTCAALWAPHVDWESAVHEAFVAAYLNWDAITKSKEAWLKKTVYHNIIDLTRSRERPTDACDAFARMSKNAAQAERLQRSRNGEEWLEVMETFAAIQGLPDSRRAAVVLRFEGADDDEIAEVLEIDRATVRRYVSEALRLVTEEVGNPERRLSMRRAVTPRPRRQRTTDQRREDR